MSVLSTPNSVGMIPHEMAPPVSKENDLIALLDLAAAILGIPILRVRVRFRG